MISLSAMGYDAEGRSAWYFGAGNLKAASRTLSWASLKAAPAVFRYAAPESIRFSGWVDVEAQSPSRAVLWFSRVDAAGTALELKPLSITRFSFAQDPGEALLGRWLRLAARPVNATVAGCIFPAAKSSKAASHEADGWPGFMRPARRAAPPLRRSAGWNWTMAMPSSSPKSACAA